MARFLVPGLLTLVACIPGARAQEVGPTLAANNYVEGGERPPLAYEPVHERAFTTYLAQISGEPAWENLFFNPLASDYIDTFLVALAYSRSYAHFYEGALQIEFEGQVAYNFGDQSLWEINAVPVVARWREFPWNHRIRTSAAFGLGLSYATEVPPIEVELEGQSDKWMVYWVAEFTAGPVEAPWQVSMRIHHRSVAYGLMGKDGGMNALGFGLRYQF